MAMKETIFWDIETGPLPEAILEERVRARKGLKDPAKIQADLQQKMERAALSAYTGQVLLVGMKQSG